MDEDNEIEIVNTSKSQLALLRARLQAKHQQAVQGLEVQPATTPTEPTAAPGSIGLQVQTLLSAVNGRPSAPLTAAQQQLARLQALKGVGAGAGAGVGSAPSTVSNEPLTAQVLGKVRSVNYRDKGNFTIYAKELDREFKCRCAHFFPIKVGDVIDGMARIEGTLNRISCLVFDQVPLVRVGLDKDTVINCFTTALKGSKFGEKKAYGLYDRFVEDCKVEGDVTEKISKLSTQYHNTNDPQFLDLYSDILEPNLMDRLLVWWHKNHSLRQLYLLGLNNKEIRDIRKSPADIHKICLQNPYRLVQLSVDKCNEIYRRIGVQPTYEDQNCALITRKIYEYYGKRGWVGVPINLLLNHFPNAAQFIARLISEYKIVCDLETVYLEDAFIIESGLTKLFHRLMRDTEGCDIKDPCFTLHTLTDEQREAIAGCLRNPMSIITGSAGSGKTTIIREIIHNLELLDVPYMMASFTGKAVARIREVTGRRMPATLHRLIARSGETDKFRFLVIDEASMVTTELFYDFLQAFGSSFQVVLVGDCNQLEPIGPGALFEQCINSGLFPIYRLNTVHRTGKDTVPGVNGILTNTEKLIKYSKYTTDELAQQPPFQYDPTSNFSLIPGNVDYVYQVLQALQKCGVDKGQVTVVTPYNKELLPINSMCQQIFNSKHQMVTDVKNKVWMVGDRVSLRINRYDINIMNGEEGVITEIGMNKQGKKTVAVHFKDNTTHHFSTYYKDDEEVEESQTGELVHDENAYGELNVKLLRHSFALTVHLSQGSEWDYVIFYVPPGGTPGFLNRRLVYTAISRAKKGVWCIGDIKALNIGSVTQPSYRCDNLARRMRNYKEIIKVTADLGQVLLEDVEPTLN